MGDSLPSVPCIAIKGEQKTLADFGDKALSVVDAASKCDSTPQHQGLEALQEKYRERGLVVLGSPYNQFDKQGPSDEGEISQFCELNYGMSFPLFRGIEASGAGAHSLSVSLKKRALGSLGSQGTKWNFTKLLIGRDGQVVKRYAPTAKLEEPSSAIEALPE